MPAPGWLAYLPHEIAHLVVYDHFAADCLPRWADEGIALLADPDGKRAAHARDLAGELRRGSQLRLGQLLQLDEYPTNDRLAVFYGQSLSLVEFFVQRGSRSQFIAFLRVSADGHVDAALESVYGITGVTELESQWLVEARKQFLTAAH